LGFRFSPSERHLRGILKEWLAHYNQGHPHSSLWPRMPEPRAKLSGHQTPSHHRVQPEPILGGLDPRVST
jgi:transposase InsO family protein